MEWVREGEWVEKWNEWVSGQMSEWAGRWNWCVWIGKHMGEWNDKQCKVTHRQIRYVIMNKQANQ